MSIFSRQRSAKRIPSSSRRRPYPALRLEPLEERTLLSFLPPTSYDVDPSPASVVTADLRRNGRLDLITANPMSHSVSVLLGKGDGTFVPARSYALDSDPAALAVGDFNNDGIPDLLVSMGDGNLGLLLGNGEGTFQPALIRRGFRNAYSLTVGDFDNDGNLDFVGAIGSELVLGLGNGDGTFRDLIHIPQYGYAVKVVAADFHHDGHLDVAVLNSVVPNVSLYRGNGDGTFGPHQDYATAGLVTDLTVADLRGNGHFDLVAGTAGGIAGYRSGVSVLLNNSDGTFQSYAYYATADLAYPVAVGDFSGDGISDIVSGSGEPGSSSDRLHVFLGIGDGTFQDAQTFDIDRGSSEGRTRFAVGDFNQDGFDDLALVDGFGTRSVRAFLNAADWDTSPRAPRLEQALSPSATLDVSTPQQAKDVIFSQALPAMQNPVRSGPEASWSGVLAQGKTPSRTALLEDPSKQGMLGVL